MRACISMPIAIVGVGLRLPGGVHDLPGLWSVLRDGVDCITEIPKTRWDTERFYHPNRVHPGSTVSVHAGVIDSLSSFDADFFGIARKEALSMDPQQRILLELAWEAMEDAGIPPSHLADSDTAVVVGAASPDSGTMHADDMCCTTPYSMTGTNLSIIANRISYIFNLHGPSFTLDTACSSSLYALYQACLLLAQGACQRAFACGVNVLLAPYPFVGFSQAYMLSPDGRCKVFDENGNGYVRSEGGGVLLLEPLEYALANGRHIHGVIRGIDCNSDGTTQGIALPSAKAQEDLLGNLYSQLGIDPNAITYLEAHGTGTSVGDPIEATAIGRSVGLLRDHALPIGSVKCHVGHLETASAMAGIMKALVMLAKRKIPGQIHIAHLNTAIDFEGLKLRVPMALEDFPESERDLIGVNSFGFGGANGHVLIEGVRAQERTHNAGTKPFFFLSAKSEESLQKQAGALARLLALGADCGTIAQTHALHRECMPVRLVLEGDRHAIQTHLEAFAKDGLANIPQGAAHFATAVAPKAKTAFVFAGNGCHWLGMGQDLLAYPPFLAKVREVSTLFQALSGIDLLHRLTHASEEDLALTEITQPLIFVLQVGICAVLAEQGIVPDVVFGHSVGEVCAAWACGAVSLADAVRIVYYRSVCQGKTKGSGKMAAAKIGLARFTELAHTVGFDEVELAGINAPNSLTMCGTERGLLAIGAVCAKERHFFKMLPLDYAFHSTSMEAIKDELLDSLAGITSQKPHTLFLSTIGDEACGKEPSDFSATYWWRNIRKPVFFAQTVQRALELGVRCFVEISPHAILQQYLRSVMKSQGISGWVTGTMQRNADNVALLQSFWKNAWVHGWPLSLSPFFPDTTYTYLPDLPKYAWHGSDLALAETPESLGYLHTLKAHPLLGWKAKEGHVFTKQVDLALMPWMGDHKVGNTAFFPAACFIETTFACAREVFGKEAQLEIANAAILRPLFLETETTQVLRTLYEPRDGELTISSRPFMQEAEWRVHSQCRVIPNQSKRPKPCTTVLSQTMWAHALPKDALYTITESHNMHYGSVFQSVDAVVLRGDNEVFARFREEDYCEGACLAEEGMLIPPAIMDGGLQLIFLLVDPAQKGPRLPYWFDRCICYHAGRPAYAHLTVQSQSERTIVCTIDYLDKQGEVLLSLRGGRARFAKRLAKKPLASFYHTEILRAASFAKSAEEDVAEFSKHLTHVCAELAESSDYARFQDAQAMAMAVAEGIVGGIRNTPTYMPKGLQDALAHYEPIFSDLPPVATLWQTLLFQAPEQSALHLLLCALHAHVVDQSAIALEPLWAALRKETFAHLSPLFDAVLARITASSVKKTVLLQGLATSVLWKWLPKLSSQNLVLADTQEGEGWDVEEGVYPAGKAHMALFANTLHTCANIPHALANIRESLLPGGLLCVFENEPSAFANILFGLDPAWWVAKPGTDEGYTSRLLTKEQWIASLKDAGFTQCEVFCVHNAKGDDPAFLVLGQKPVSEEDKSEKSPCMVVALPSPYLDTAFVKACATGLGLAETVLDDTVLEEAIATKTPLILPLALLDPFACDAAIAVCSQLTTLAKTLDAKGALAHPLLVLTQTAFADGRDLQPALGAALGTIRVLRNEYPPMQITLLDLPKTPDADTFDNVRDLLAHPLEAELIIRGGDRFVLRSQELAQAEEKAGDGLRLVCREPGRLESLAWEPVPLPTAQGESVVIEVAATGLNFRDVMWAMNLLPEEALEQGMSGACLGFECAGRVLAVGDKVHTVSVGDRVVAFASDCFASHVVTKETYVAKIPDNWDFPVAASVPTTFCTAYYALRTLANIQPGERVLIHGAAGGVGLAAIQIALALGAELYCTAGSPVKRHYLELLGVEHIYDSRSLSFMDAILEDTGGEGIDCVLNSLAGEAINAGLALLRPFGRFLELGKSDLYQNSPMRLRPFRQNISYYAIDLDQLMRERPQQGQSILRDVMQGFRDGSWMPLPVTVFEGECVQESFRLMQSAKHVGKIVVVPPKAPLVQEKAASTPALVVKEQATYVVTGGTQGFGLASAEALLAKGATSLLLLSRSGENAHVVDLRARYPKAQIVAESCDVADSARVADILHKTTQPPIAGILHAAAVLDDALVANVDDEKIARVFRPKVGGAFALDAASRDLPLDFFVVYSSVTTLVGNPGQVNYVAANMVMESLMSYRRSLGLPGLAIGWGAIADCGMLSRDTKTMEGLVARTGIVPLTAKDAFACLSTLSCSCPTTTFIFTADWRTLGHLPLLVDPRFAALTTQLAIAESERQSIFDQIQGLSPEKAHDVVLGAVIATIARVVRTSPKTIAADRPLQSLGIDSLMGVELGLALEELLGGHQLALAISHTVSAQSITAQILTMAGSEEHEHEEPYLAGLAESHGLTKEQAIALQGDTASI
ncbi:MAG: SDR family NAD(P)-dependent oxidoreductase [Desulfovibrio sp.]|nr:SDR family NAD(P)-dependent oxidoreductase [Desulfovibrio sp.]